MADEHDVGELFGADEAANVLDMGRKIHRFVEQVRALAEAGERRREHAPAAGFQPVGDEAPAPAAVPGAVDEDEGRGRGSAHAGRTL